MTPLLELLADGQFHTGPQLAEALGVSRAAINLQVQAARARGVEIESVQSRGYRMPGGAQWLSESRLASTLRRSYPAVQVKVFDSIDSTNERALAQSAPWPELQVLMAEHQTSGRGRRGRGWVSPWGHNLYMSCAVAFTDGLPAGASIRAGCAVASVLHKHGVKGVGLKWPNDLQVAGHKVGGILVEIQGDPTGHCRAVVGLGLNLKTPTKAGVQIDQPYADLRQVGLPDTVSRSLLAGRVAKALADALLKPREDWVAQFTRWDVLADQPVRASGAQNVMQGVAAGIDTAGNLLIQTQQGVQVVHSGEVSVRADA